MTNSDAIESFNIDNEYSVEAALQLHRMYYLPKLLAQQLSMYRLRILLAQALTKEIIGGLGLFLLALLRLILLFHYSSTISADRTNTESQAWGGRLSRQSPLRSPPTDIAYYNSARLYDCIRNNIGGLCCWSPGTVIRLLQFPFQLAPGSMSPYI